MSNGTEEKQLRGQCTSVERFWVRNNMHICMFNNIRMLNNMCSTMPRRSVAKVALKDVAREAFINGYWLKNKNDTGDCEAGYVAIRKVTLLANTLCSDVYTPEVEKRWFQFCVFSSSFFFSSFFHSYVTVSFFLFAHLLSYSV